MTAEIKTYVVQEYFADEIGWSDFEEYASREDAEQAFAREAEGYAGTGCWRLIERYGRRRQGPTDWNPTNSFTVLREDLQEN